MGTLLYTWVKSREAPSPESKESILPMTTAHNLGSRTKLLEAGGDDSDEDRSISDSEEIFATGAHDFDEEANIRSQKS
jgi:hypothetical protein